MTRGHFYTVFRTAAGWMGLLGSGAGLRRVVLPQGSESEVRRALGDDAIFSPDFFTDIVARLTAYFEGERVDFRDKLDFSPATGFQRAVWRAARRIPYGETRSYGWLAGQIGRPGAARAVGQALGRNPLPVIVPCHRVLGGGGGLGGYRGGLEVKRFLLRLEAGNDPA
ncbi:MAG TPA: methylated-DNA--[protein]-cysteine S-methyltransferase [Dehalococcoidales bacterium]|nr:MAG: hypothetical protein A2Z05_07865 [Chloroflexi bacterium RBG_16_60_22]HJX12651.1 methylated-DNA--[protein]-cysteine S-methyltransferase [Dehalococcoidales bacterium]